MYVLQSITIHALKYLTHFLISILAPFTLFDAMHSFLLFYVTALYVLRIHVSVYSSTRACSWEETFSSSATTNVCAPPLVTSCSACSSIHAPSVTTPLFIENMTWTMPVPVCIKFTYSAVWFRIYKCTVKTTWFVGGPGVEKREKVP